MLFFATTLQLYIILSAYAEDLTPQITATSPSFHSVKVFIRNPHPSYQVEICDQQPWGGSAHCKKTSLKHEIKFENLQMSTIYSLTILENSGKKKNSVTFKTKDFKVLATKCQKDETRVLLETGPYFGGSISIEPYFKDDKVNKCSLRGNATSDKSTYLYIFQHEACVGVVKNAVSGIEATLIVQENWPILTASTKRFRIACSFKSSEFTVQAGLHMPSSNSIRKGKSEDIQASKYTSSGTDYQSIFFLKPNQSHTNGQVVLMVILVLSAIIGILATTFWIRSLMKKKNSMIVEEETVLEQQQKQGTSTDYENVTFTFQDNTPDKPRCLQQEQDSSFA